MLLTVWTESSGYKFTNSGQPFQEQVAVDIALPVINDSGVSYQIISGSLPGGLSIIGNHIKGSPYVVSHLITYEFCIRATKGNDFADRTFYIEVNGVNDPEFITPAGNLAVGVHQQLYALDGSYISYQIEAFDLNTLTGAKLKYFISSGDGHLPPGLILSDSGLISGYLLPNPLTIIDQTDGNGTFDTTYYDGAGYDFAVTPTDGYDTYQYDDVYFDYNTPVRVPTTLNQNYQFKVTVSDGIATAQRIFKIFVLGSDQFKADSTALDGFAGSFTADSSFLRTPVWLTNSNLGIYRANNYLTVPIALFDNSFVIFRLETTNCEIYAVTQRLSLVDNIQGSTNISIINATGVPVKGQYLTFDNYIVGATEQRYQIDTVTSLGGGKYRLTVTTPLLIDLPALVGFYIGTLSKLPKGTEFDVNTGEIFGRVPYQPQITQSYKFTITAVREIVSPTNTEKVISNRTFIITILGSITSAINWISPSNLGTVPADYICTLSVQAASNIPNATVLYEITSGSLPPGLTMTLDGEIVGKPNQYHNVATGLLGLTIFDGGDFTFDRNKTTIDRTYTFTVTANDQYQYSALPRTFTISISTPNAVPYSNVTTRPFLEPTQRNYWRAFISDPNIFTPDSIYRTNDANFGVQSDLNMLVYAGIQTEDAAAYVGAMGLGFKRKRFKFDSVKLAVAVDDSGNEVYEVIYIQMIDPMESNGKHLPLSIKSKNVDPETIKADTSNSIWSINLADLEIASPSAVRPDFRITTDSTGYQSSNANISKYYPSSITTWQERLSTVGLSERNYLPLWMRSIPSGSKEQLGYILAVPLCFCKPGTASKIMLNIKYSDFNFNTLDYTVDRFTISAVTGYTSDKYLMFRNDRITV